MKDVVRVLRALEDVEAKMEDLYRWFTEIFAEDADAADFFDQMSREERQHHTIVGFQIRLVYRERKSFGPVDVDWQGILEVTSRIMGLRGSAPPSLAEAIEAAMQIESSAAEVYYQSVLIQANPALKDLIRQMADENKRHARSLANFAKDRGLIVEEPA